MSHEVAMVEEVRRMRHAFDRMETVLMLLLERSNVMATALSEILASIDNATNEIAAEGDQIGAELAALRAQLAGAPTVTQATLDLLQSTSDRLVAASAKLKGIAADPANPVPAPAPAPSDLPAA